MKILRSILFLIILPLKFINCSSGYKKVDGKWVYISYDEGNWADKHYIDVDHQSFKTLDDKRYGKDNSKVFFEGNIIENADSKSFRVIGNDYSADNYQVFLRIYPLIGADPKSFRNFKFPYTRDNKQVFCGTVPMKIDDIENFKLTKKDLSYSTQAVELFIKQNPEYSYIDTTKYKYVTYFFCEAETTTEKFKGFKKQGLPTSLER
jgi:hypothetical protein